MVANQAPSIKVGILSMGDMGSGIARLLVARGYHVATNCAGRSDDTTERALRAGVELLSDIELVEQCQVFLSVVPPANVEATAQRVIDALSGSKRQEPLYYADLNAVSPSTVRMIASRFEKTSPLVRFIDGCILGGPPELKTAADTGSNVSASDTNDAEWNRPRLPISGPHSLDSLPGGERLASVLNMRSISSEIGPASGLKMCFASMSKGFTALATQAFATAHKLGVGEELAQEMTQILPKHLDLVRRGVPAMPPKAYRWVREMEEIATTMSEDGGWGRSLFDGAAEVYNAVAQDKALGQEKIGKRKRGTTVEDVASLLAEGLEAKRKKND
ncbi:6-phosphogluconate dehydrogenase [Stachybotrys elegans]|uniref:6-phosphogluconate dehydrogenase n=1 Tax=Stachybotrys elegans TaxID=80388 RepID=A0A8K0T3P5_9HYPO|nr:6-phosphogluconate dehydrogenase [Stachybotrys elegans]